MIGGICCKNHHNATECKATDLPTKSRKLQLAGVPFAKVVCGGWEQQ